VDGTALVIGAGGHNSETDIPWPFQFVGSLHHNAGISNVCTIHKHPRVIIIARERIETDPRLGLEPSMSTQRKCM
jgi:hypothetical protein